MGKLMLSVNITRNGMVADKNGGLAWHFPFWDHQMSELLSKLLGSTQMLLLGKNTYQSFAAFWPERTHDLSLSRSDIVLTEIFNQVQKVVVSQSLRNTSWNANLLTKGSILQEISNLKNNNDGEILVLGSISLARSILKANLFDGFILWEHPINLHGGIPFFDRHPLFSPNYVLISSTELDSGVLMRHFEKFTTKAPRLVNWLVG